MQAKLGMSPSVAACRDTCVEVATGAGMDESMPSSPRGSSALVEGKALKATDGGSLCCITVLGDRG